jgi:hypothetical protein
MKTQRRILLVVAAVLVAFGGLVALAVIVLGSLLALMLVTAAVAAYLTWIRPQWQHLRPGDQILMMPGSGFDVVGVEDGRCFVARAPDGTTSWCLAAEPLDRHSCRVISRWHARWHITAASALWIALSDPGTFIMERKMLLGIKARAEHAAQPGLAHHR